MVGLPNQSVEPRRIGGSGRPNLALLRQPLFSHVAIPQLERGPEQVRPLRQVRTNQPPDFAFRLSTVLCADPLVCPVET